MFGALGLPELLICAVGGGGFLIWIWTLVDAVTKEKPESQDRLIWTLIVLFAGPFGALIYLVVRRPARIREDGR